MPSQDQRAIHARGKVLKSYYALYTAAEEHEFGPAGSQVQDYNYELYVRHVPYKTEWLDEKASFQWLCNQYKQHYDENKAFLWSTVHPAGKEFCLKTWHILQRAQNKADLHVRQHMQNLAQVRMEAAELVRPQQYYLNHLKSFDPAFLDLEFSGTRYDALRKSLRL